MDKGTEEDERKGDEVAWKGLVVGSHCTMNADLVSQLDQSVLWV